MQPVFRFAPSPNGELHLGHAYSAILNHRLARDAGGCFLLRHEDIDRERCRPMFERGVEEALRFLGLDWDGVPRRQSDHFADYREALDALVAGGFAYPAFMTRGEVKAFAARFEEENGRPWPRDPDGAPVYPGTDRDLGAGEREARIAGGEPFAWRLDMGRALGLLGRLTFREEGAEAGDPSGEVAAEPALWGDVVLARKDVPTSYHLSVVVDDALQGVTHVVRGRDLLPSTSVHRVLQALLGLPAPCYRHHDLILDADGRKLSKSAGDTSLRVLREAGLAGDDIRRMVGL